MRRVVGNSAHLLRILAYSSCSYTGGAWPPQAAVHFGKPRTRSTTACILWHTHYAVLSEHQGGHLAVILPPTPMFRMRLEELTLEWEKRGKGKEKPNKTVLFIDTKPPNALCYLCGGSEKPATASSQGIKIDEICLKLTLIRPG